MVWQSGEEEEPGGRERRRRPVARRLGEEEELGGATAGGGGGDWRRNGRGRRSSAARWSGSSGATSALVVEVERGFVRVRGRFPCFVSRVLLQRSKCLGGEREANFDYPLFSLCSLSVIPPAVGDEKKYAQCCW
ncbi:hypothetical protein PR202_ga16714 [Eleusine coracana subsp. coracana]|uniref:Uncharacterized protein n=1 Tax=Eleusine coracana subsp. coracana TaxID=191504 RepID=A0AAV5CNJ9_ELECO|nr:hypothetical protein PR202_ga16714 [Eleusine coracana subsp. coracana]